MAYNNIDARTQNVKCGSGVAKRQDGGGDGDACSLESLSSTTATLPPLPVETLYQFGSPENQCPSLQLDSCTCHCSSAEDCGPCAETFVAVCVSTSTVPGCCQCQ